MIIRLHIAVLLAAFAATINPVPMSRYPDSQKVRKPAVAGQFYPSSAKEINAIAGLLAIMDSEGLGHFNAEHVMYRNS